MQKEKLNIIINILKVFKYLIRGTIINGIFPCFTVVYLLRSLLVCFGSVSNVGNFFPIGFSHFYKITNWKN